MIERRRGAGPSECGCEWIDGEPASAPCGKPTVPGWRQPYCIAHALASLVPWARDGLVNHIARQERDAA